MQFFWSLLANFLYQISKPWWYWVGSEKCNSNVNIKHKCPQVWLQFQNLDRYRMFSVPRINSSILDIGSSVFGWKSFRYLAPTVWNWLLHQIRLSRTFWHLQTLYYTQLFTCQCCPPSDCRRLRIWFSCKCVGTVGLIIIIIITTTINIYMFIVVVVIIIIIIII